MFGHCEACGKRFPLRSYFRLRNEFTCRKCGAPYTGTVMRFLTTVLAAIAGIATGLLLADSVPAAAAVGGALLVILAVVAVVPGQLATARPGADIQRDKE